MSNFSIASILNLPVTPPAPISTKTEDTFNHQQTQALAIMLQQQAAVMAMALDQGSSHTDQVDLNQNVKKKRGRKKGSKNRPKDVIMKEKLKRSKSENGNKLNIYKRDLFNQTIDSDSTILTAPNLPVEETCENEVYLLLFDLLIEILSLVFMCLV